MVTTYEQTPTPAIFLTSGEQATWGEEEVERRREVTEVPPHSEVVEPLHEVEEGRRPTVRSRSGARVAGSSLLLMNSSRKRLFVGVRGCLS